MAKQEDSGHSFLAYFKRATSPLAVLRILSDRPMYGYELIQELKQRSGGKYQLSLLYPVLYRLEEQGYLEISSSEIVGGRARNYYAVTPAGTPDEAAQELLSGIAPERVQAFQKKLHRRYLLAAVLIVVIVCCAALIYAQVMMDSSVAYAEEHITILPTTDLSAAGQ